MPRLRGWLREPVDVADGCEVLWLPPLAATATMGHSEVDMTTLNQETAGLFAGSYPLGRLLGRGGMADVYASVDARTGDRSPSKCSATQTSAAPPGAAPRFAR